ncbi:MAG: hypothetical protein WCW68_13895 [Methanothrix sp.]
MIGILPVPAEDSCLPTCGCARWHAGACLGQRGGLRQKFWGWGGQWRGRALAWGSAAGPGRPEGQAARARALGSGGAGCGKQEGRDAARRAKREYVKAANCYAARIINQEAI